MTLAYREASGHWEGFASQWDPYPSCLSVAAIGPATFSPSAMLCARVQARGSHALCQRFLQGRDSLLRHAHSLSCLDRELQVLLKFWQGGLDVIFQRRVLNFAFGLFILLNVACVILDGMFSEHLVEL